MIIIDEKEMVLNIIRLRTVCYLEDRVPLSLLIKKVLPHIIWIIKKILFMVYKKRIKKREKALVGAKNGTKSLFLLFILKKKLRILNEKERKHLKS